MWSPFFGLWVGYRGRIESAIPSGAYGGWHDSKPEHAQAITIAGQAGCGSWANV